MIEWRVDITAIPTQSPVTNPVPGLLTVVGCTKTISRTVKGCQTVAVLEHILSMTWLAQLVVVYPTVTAKYVVSQVDVE